MPISLYKRCTEIMLNLKKKRKFSSGPGFMIVVRGFRNDVALPSFCRDRSLALMNFIHSKNFPGRTVRGGTASLPVCEVLRAASDFYPFAFIFRKTTPKDIMENQYFLELFKEELLLSDPWSYWRLVETHRENQSRYVNISQHERLAQLQAEAQDASLSNQVDITDFGFILHYFPRFELAENLERKMIIDIQGFEPSADEEIILLDVYDPAFHFTTARLIVGFLTERELLVPEVLKDDFDSIDDPLSLGLTSNLIRSALNGENGAAFKRIFVPSRLGSELLDRRFGPAHVRAVEKELLDFYTTWHREHSSLTSPRVHPTFWP